MTTDEVLCGQFADKLIGFALKAQEFMTPGAIWTAFLAAAVGYAKGHQIPEARIIEHLRGVADTLERTEPPAPTAH